MIRLTSLESAGESLASFSSSYNLQNVSAEHATSVRTAHALHVLDRYSMDLFKGNQPEDVEAVVSGIFDEEISPNPDNHYPVGNRPFNYKAVAISNALRTNWHNNYYQQRSHPTTENEFLTWITAYSERYLDRQTIAAKLIQRTFQTVYRSNIGTGYDTNLRTSKSDLVLIQGVGSQAVTTLEATGTRVQSALASETLQHNHIYSLDTPPERLTSGIVIPIDIYFQMKSNGS